MISIIVPSRNRPNELKSALDTLQLKENGLEALVWVDTDDPQLEKYQELFGKHPNIRLFIKERVGYRNSHVMLNFLASQAKFDWFLGFSDDTYFANPNWFQLTSNFLKQFKPKIYPIDINIWDPEVNKYNLFVFVSRKFFELLGHISLLYMADTWVNTVSLRAGILYCLPGINPKHRKYTDENPLKDAIYYEVEKERQEIKAVLSIQRNPYRQQVKDDVKKIIEYNLSIEPPQLAKGTKKGTYDETK